jgi:probable rRNA maturation factor
MIQFTNQETRFVLKNKIRIRGWVRTILKNEGKKLGDLTYIFCSDGYLLQLNKKYLHHQTLTDIITFDYSENAIVSGDIFISIDRVSENAVTYSRSFGEELGRVMAHGVLHLVGYNDKSEEEKAIMTTMEDKYLPSFPSLKNA